MLGWWHRCGETLHAFGGSVPFEPVATAAGGLAGAVAGVGLAGFVVVGIRRAWWLRIAAAVPLYSRLSPRDVAAHPKRARILALVRARPGASTADLVEASKLNGGTLQHHLRMLERAQLVKSLLVGRDRVWFEAGTPVDAHRLAVLHAPARRRILGEVGRSPGMSQADLAGLLGLSRPAIHHHVAALQAAGLVRLQREGVRTRCFPASEGPARPADL